MPSPARRVALIAATLLVPVAIFAVRYELAERERYRAWKAKFDNFGWLGRITVASPNPVLLWEYKPDTRYAQKGGAIRTNRYGFRGWPDVSLEKPPDVHRVAFLGASVTLGMFVPAKQTYVERFETFARQRFPGRRIEALNFGVDGYSAVQVGELMRERVLAFAPDAVDYLITLASFDFEDASGEKKRYFQPPRSFFLDASRRALQRFSRRRLGYFGYHFERNRDVVFEEILRMQRDLEARGISLHVTLLPAFPRERDGFERYPHAAIHAEIRAFLDAAGIQSIDLLDRLREQGVPPRELAIDVWHPNARGHALLARAILDAHAPDLAKPPAGAQSRRR